MATAYSTGVNKAKEDKFTADTMYYPGRWVPISDEPLRTEYQGVGGRPNDIDAIVNAWSVEKQDIAQRAQFISSLPAFINYS
jgi:hypothetical protein